MTHTFTVTISDNDERYPCRPTQTLLAGMECLGRKGIPVGCRGGGCGLCKVRITAGRYAARKMSRAHVSAADQTNGIVLACRCTPQSDVTLTVLGPMRKAVCKPASPPAKPTPSN